MTVDFRMITKGFDRLIRNGSSVEFCHVLQKVGIS